MIHQACENCGHPLDIPDEYAGKIGRCAKCGAKVHVALLPTTPPAPARKTGGQIHPSVEPATAPAHKEKVEEEEADASESIDDAYAQIERLAKLKEMGAITEQEFAATKARLLFGLGRREQGTQSDNGNRPTPMAEPRQTPPPIKPRRENAAAAISAGHQQAAIMIQAKSTGVAAVLTLFFGGLGLLYASISGGIIMSLVEVFLWFIALITLGIGSILLLPFHAVCVIWAIMAVGSHNKRLLAQSMQRNSE